MKVLAISGGVDSMFLLSKMLKENKKEELVVAHINHGFREESEDEKLMVENYCKENKILFEYKKLSLLKKDELTAREARYDFLYEVCEKYNSKELYLGHHADDLTETFIMNITKGATGEGLICMSEENILKNGIVAKRPLLKYSKEQIYKIATEENIEWMEDESNKKDDLYKRNKIRLNIIPNLKELNNNLNENISRITNEQREIEELLSELVEVEIKKIKIINGFYMIEKKQFEENKIILKKRILKKIMKDLGKEKVKFNILEVLEEKINSKILNTDIQFLNGEIILINMKDCFLLSNINNYNKFDKLDLNAKEKKKIKNFNVPTAFRGIMKKEANFLIDPLNNEYKVE